MLKSIAYILQLAFLLAILAFLMAQQGQFDITIGSYRLRGDVSVLLAGSFLIVLIGLSIHRFWIDLLHFPLHFRRYRRDIRLEKGHRALTRALSSLAVGDMRAAQNQARRARDLLPEFAALPTILLATTAQKLGDTDIAHSALQSLMSTDARDLGVRGLVQAAARAGDYNRALDIALSAWAATPRMWPLARIVYDLECQTGRFNDAHSRHALLYRHGLMGKDEMKEHDIVLRTARAQQEIESGNHKQALSLLKHVEDQDVGFVPAACALIDLYRGYGRTSRAMKTLHRAFKKMPHPDLIERHEQMAPQFKDVRKRMRYHERFFTLAPESIPARLLMARVCMQEQMTGEARAHLEHALTINACQSVYRALAHLADRQGDSDAARQYMDDAMHAFPDDGWYYAVTHCLYPKWVPLNTESHLFATVKWGVPGTMPIQIQKSQAEQILPGR
jgi:uncharacterized membrane-anchored protein